MLPHQIGLGAIAAGNLERGKKAAYEEGRITAEEMLAANMRWTFSPCGGVAENMRWGRSYECYSENLEIVTELTLQNVQGLQDNGVGACIKHWIGEGQVQGDNPNTNQGNRNNNPITRERIMEIAGVYRAAVETWTIMPSYLGLNITGTGSGTGNYSMHTHKPMMQDYLKDELGWNGMMIGDYRWHTTPDSVNAGLDCLMAAERSTDYLRNTERNGILNGCTEKRIDDAVMRMLRFKKRIGLFDNPYLSSPGQIRKPENVAAARSMAADSMVLLRNKNNFVQDIQGSKFKNIMVAGRASEGNKGRGYQCGGWTIGWQGSDQTSDRVTAVTIFEGIDAAKGGGVNVTSSVDGSEEGAFDLIIAVIAEMPYAESEGDIPNRWSSGGCILGPDMAMLENVYAKKAANPGTKILVVILSGRPIAFSPQVGTGAASVQTTKGREFEKWDGLIEAWLPGDQAGAALADLLFTNREFAGKTPQPWHEGIDKTGELIYPYGYGLKKSDPVDMDFHAP